MTETETLRLLVTDEDGRQKDIDEDEPLEVNDTPVGAGNGAGEEHWILENGTLEPVDDADEADLTGVPIIIGEPDGDAYAVRQQDLDDEIDGLDADDVDAIATGEKGADGGVAELTSSGQLPSGQLPDLAITDVYVVDDTDERLGLDDESDTDIEQGDVAIESDNDESYIFKGGDPADDEDWAQLQFNAVAEIKDAVIEPAEVHTDKIENEQYVEPVHNVTVSSDTNLDAGYGIIEATLTGDAELDLTGAHSDPDGNSVTVIVKQDSTGGHALSWDDDIEWSEGEEPDVTEDVHDKHVFTFISPDAGSTWIGMLAAEEVE